MSSFKKKTSVKKSNRYRWFSKNPQEMFELAGCYYTGEGVKRNLNACIKLIKAAALNGHAAAAEALAMAYRDGEGLKQNYRKCFKWFLYAAEHGCPESMYSLSVRYELGQGVEKCQEKSMMWLAKAAGAGHVVAQRRLGEAYYYGEGVPKDVSLAFYWCRQAALKNDPEGAYCVGLIYLEGDAVDLNLVMAQHWLRIAAYQNYTDAQLDLARTLFRENTKDSCEEGLIWLRRGAQLGNSECMLGLGMLLSTGTYYAPLDVEQARKWYVKALENGEEKARWFLDRL